MFSRARMVLVAPFSSQAKPKSKSWFGWGLLGAGVATAYLAIDSTSPFHRYVLIPLLHSVDPETAHVIGIQAASYRLSPRDLSRDPPELKTSLWGKQFSNPVGLAAGFDKHAQAIDPLLAMGFGFVEIGSVTPLPQPGNPKPRMFRLPEDRAVVNRYGFNSDGVELVKERLEKRSQQKKSGSFLIEKGILGVNLGKNKEQTDAAADYITGLKALGRYADYIVINVSSPNTPGLRSLQGEKELYDLITRVKKIRDEMKWESNPPPLLVKIAPDLTEEDKDQIARVVLDLKVDGLIISNTTISRDGLKSSSKNEVGGLSGKPLFKKSTQTLADMYKRTQGKIPLIGVGGISTGKEAYEKIRKGASLVQLYTSLAYEGPGIVHDVKHELASLLKRDGFISVSQAVGVDVK